MMQTMALEGKYASSLSVAIPRDAIDLHRHNGTRIILVSLPPALLEERASALGVDVARLELGEGQCDDAQIIHIVTALALAANDEGGDQAIVCDRLVDALCARLIAPQDMVSGGRAQELSLPQKRRVIDFIEARLAEKLSLSQIAKVARVSASHLKVLFRRTFGVPVHQYIIRRRVERAAEMIKGGVGPLSDVAVAAGFAHQSHLSRCMKRVLGTTPAALARGAR